MRRLLLARNLWKGMEWAAADPVSKMDVHEEKTAVHINIKAKTHYFCEDGSKEKHSKAPENAIIEKEKLLDKT